LIPKISPLAVLSIARNQLRIDRMARTVPLDAPWTAAKAAEWDRRTVADFLARTGIRSRAGRALFDMAVRGLFTGPHDDTSLLDLLFLAHSHGSINKLFSIEKGSQDALVVGGAGTMARRMADELDVRLGAPVRSVTQAGDLVTVTADGVGVEVRARHVVIAIPPVLIGDIVFEPVLPSDRRELYRLAVAGPESKTLVVYDRPFWRDDGFNGQSSEPGSASETTLDSSPADGSHGVLASFTFGSVAAQVDELPADERRRLVVDAMVRRFGPKAAAPVAYVETAWWKEPWTRGCSMAHFPPGVLTRYGHLLREPWQRIHWAGTETATISHGAIDGAIRSGQRAAAEILDRV
jgi:monoamine oxidase